VTQHREEYVDNEFEAPRGELEELVAQIIANVLGVDRVGRTDSYYDFGGTSLQAVLISARIDQETGIHAGLAWLFETDVVADFVKRLEMVRPRVPPAGQADQ